MTSLRTELARLAPGDRLPSSRELVRKHEVSPGTVGKAIAQLATEGVVITRPGSGTFVAPRRASTPPADLSWQAVALTDRRVDAMAVTSLLSPPPAEGITLAGGYLHPDLRPTRALGAALARAARRPDAWDRAPTEGLPALRTIFARLAGGTVNPDDVLVTGGGQGALNLALRAVTAPGDAILVESPTYPGALAAARAAGLRPVPVPLDAGGIRSDLLAEAFAHSGARLLYCQPTWHNPTGAVLAPHRRREVLAVARAAGAFVLEDDFARLLGHGGTALPPLVADDRDGTVIHLTSLTKPAAPSLRVGAVIARGPVRERLRATRLVDDFFVPRPLQEATIELVSAPAWARHLRGLATALADRRAVLTAALAEHIPDWTVTGVPTGGLHLWVRTTSDPARLVDSARRARVAVSDGRGYFAAEPSGDYLRIGFAATADTAELIEGVRRLSTAAALDSP
nr:Transcriptional regulator, GntR family domain / Aspartate aminotransferase [Kibdelosporangium sp. MJ126-NF4]CTQ88193.1 Transcriptional regulator, GntR family domain / Aspartate aminotransferase (EC 2.6.1.1) [Kibdelosporangium sp. MJ126-NF4]